MSSLAKGFILVLVMLISASVVSTSPTVAAQNTPTWATQLVDPRGEGGQIVFDSKDNPHILYSILSDWDLRIGQNLLNYAVWNGQNWTTQYVTITNGATLTLDSNDTPQIVNKANDSFAFIGWDGTKWNTEKTVPVPEGLGDRWSGLNYNSSGNLRLVYPYGEYYDSDRQNVSLKYALWNGSNWSIQTIENRLANYSDNYAPKSVVYDSNGYPHILYQESTTHSFYSPNAISYNMAHFTEVHIKYAVWTGLNWNIETVAVNATAYNLVLNSMGEPSFCFVQEKSTYDHDYDGWRTEESLHYAHFNGADWDFSTIDANGSYAEFAQAQLRLDNAGKPQVCYYKISYRDESGLMFATLSGSSWTIQRIGSVAFNDIAFDSKGNIHITYTSVIGSFNAAPRYGDLTYASLEESLETPSPDYTILFGAVFATFIIAIFIFIFITIYRKRS
jgi:hypothetical protein